MTEEHIKKLQREGKKGIRYTAMMPNVLFLVLGLMVLAGLAGGVIGAVQIAVYPVVPKSLVWMAAGGFLNFVTGMPIYFSFRKGIDYGVQ